MDDPTIPAAWGASAFDDEGLPCRRNVMIEAGVLSCFLYDSTSARRAGTTSTASAVRAGYRSAPGVGARASQLLPGELSAEGVLAHVGDGLLVQSVTGLHSGVNLVSGDFSVGAEGLLVHGGELADAGKGADDRIKHPAHAPWGYRCSQRPRVAALAGGRRNPRYFRNVDERDLNALYPLYARSATNGTKRGPA